jgi:CBS domain-containing protein
MKRNVFKLEPSSTIEDAVTAFTEMHISGAPVVDRNGRLVGMLSAFDIARPENVRHGAVRSARDEYSLDGRYSDEDDDFYDEVVYSKDGYSPEVLKTGTVEDFMTSEVITIGPSTQLREVCKLMLKEHIHRVPVVDDDKLVGIISTLDVVRCIAETA